MTSKPFIITGIFLLSFLLNANPSGAQSPSQQAGSHSPVSVNVYDRTRVEAWQWFAAPPRSETYGYAESLLRVSVSGSVKHYEWQLELSQPSVLGAPNDAVSSNTAQGQMGLGATYFAANGNNRNAAAAFLKQGFLRYRTGEASDVRIGRFEFFEGQETKPKDASLAWLQSNRISQRLIGSFGFSTLSAASTGSTRTEARPHGHHRNGRTR